MVAVSRYTPELVRAYVDAGYWNERLTVDYWEANARDFPRREAVSDGATSLTWRQAAEGIDRLAAGLLAQGFGKDSVLLVQAFNSIPLLLLRLACEKAGIILSFLHHTFRRAEIEPVIEKTRPFGAAIAGNSGRFDYLSLYLDLQNKYDFLEKLLLLDGGAAAGTVSIPTLIAQPLEPGLPRAVLERQKFRPFEMTAIMTSSGTTGSPKLVEYSPWPRLASGRVYIQRLRMTPDDVVVAFIPLYTGAADMLFHTAPQVGAKQVLHDSFAPEAACRLMESEGATGAIVVPTLLIRLLNFSGLERYDLSRLRFVTCSGGVLSAEIAQQAEERLGAKIIQAYGLMDCGALTSHSLDDPPAARLGSVGRVLDGGELSIVDDDGKEVPPGQPGQIRGRGPHCNGGYFHDQAATDAGWQGGFFSTGDIGRIDPNGFLVLEGRLKDVIIRGGQNISASQVETLLVGHPAIAEAAVVPMADQEMGERACAFVVTVEGRQLSLGDVVAFMKGQGVAAFMIPERLELIREMPTNSAGKVDKSLLRTRVAETIKRERPAG